MISTGLKSKLNPKLEKYFLDYARDHQTFGNQLTHAIGIPLIFISSLGVLSHIGPPLFNGGVVSMAAVLTWFFTLDWKLAIPSGLLMMLCYELGKQIPSFGLILIFVLGWIFQLVGHYVYEKKKPSFLSNINHLLIGPFWFVAKIMQY
jgi:uncharacterized membrane protein YGL010W